MRTAGKNRAIKNAFYRLGMHVKPPAVVQALAEQGVVVEEEMVRLVQFELLKDRTTGRVARISRPVPPRAVRRRPQGFPGRSRG
jgi:hypothetical protein